MEEYDMGEQPDDAGTSIEDGNKPTSGDTSDAGAEPKKTITLTTKQLAERLERAKPADYDDLKAKAERLAEIEEANKSEQERQAERLSQLEREAQEARTEALRFKVAAEHGVRPEHMKFLTGADEGELAERARELVELYGEQSGPRTPKPDPNQGRQSGGPTSTADQFAASVGGLL